MKTELLNEIISNVQNYERTSMGVKYGDDFPAFATELIASDEFGTIVMQANMLGLLTAMTFGKEEKPTAPAEKMKSGPLRDIIAMSIYIGYRLGKSETQSSSLEKMMKA